MDPDRLRTLCGAFAREIFLDEGRLDDAEDDLAAAIQSAVTEWLSANPASDEESDGSDLRDDDDGPDGRVDDE